MATYLVGGAVRDRLLGRQPSERDWVVVGSTREAMEATGYKRVGKDFPVFLHPETGEEYALARRERKSGHGYHGFAIQAGPEVTLEQDLERRDLTINAMAEAPDGTIIDPFDGQTDLAQRQLRHVSDAFVEDPLRVLRVARFAARFAGLGFTVAPETRQLMATIAAGGELEWLAPERIWRETERALAEPTPERFFDELAAVAALERIAPELAALFAGETPTLARRALEYARHAELAAAQRFAALCHPLAPHESRERLLGRLPVPRAWAELARLAARWHEPFLDDATTRTAEGVWHLLTGCDALRRRERFEQLLAVLEAIARAHGYAHRASAPLRAGLRAALAIDGGALARQGWRGAELGAELERRRRSAIQDALTELGGDRR